MSQKIPILNHRELTEILRFLSSQTKGLSVDRVFVAERKQTPQLFLMSEWIIRLGSKNRGFDLALSLRSNAPYLCLHPFGTFKNFAAAPHSGFDLSLSKHIVGRKLLNWHQQPDDRWLRIDWSGGYSLWLGMIPATPEAYLVDSSSKVLGQNRLKPVEVFTPPLGRGAPPELQIRPELTEKIDLYPKQVEAFLTAEAIAQRKRRIEKTIQELAKSLQKLIEKSQDALNSSRKEKDWKTLGDSLKHSSTESRTQIVHEHRFRWIRNYSDQDFEQNPELQWSQLEVDPALDIAAQIKKFYTHQRRKQKRIQEASTRLQRSQEDHNRLLSQLNELKNIESDFKSLEKNENSLGLTSESHLNKKGQKTAQSPGRVCISREGLTIRVGRDREENLELTLRHAKGKDIWLHIKGRPSAHAVIEIPPKKSASLETLLDAAHLVLHFSKAQTWGKTEVDYTFRKNVKRISGTSEVSYSQNKTLIIDHDQKRVDRLLGASS